jgi:hypothetical protein
LALPSAFQDARTLGYTRTPVSRPAARTRRSDVAVFLEVENGNSLPLPTPNAKWPMRARGLRFEPSVVSCAVDEEVVLTNDDKAPINVTVGETQLGEIGAGKSKNFKCARGGTNAVRVAEWNHMRGAIFVGELGVAGRPDGEGRFSVAAPEGSYELKVVGQEGIVMTRPINVGKGDVDVGTIDVEGGKDAAPPAVEPPPARGAKPAKPAVAAPKPKPKPAAAKREDDEIKMEP